MKQFAIAFAAIIATSAMAQETERIEKPFAMSVSHSVEPYLALQIGNDATVKLPRARAPRGSDIVCSGWQLVDSTDLDYEDFQIIENIEEGRGACSSYTFSADQATQLGGEYVDFQNDCNVDELGNFEQVSILVEVKPNNLG